MEKNEKKEEDKKPRANMEAKLAAIMEEIEGLKKAGAEKDAKIALLEQVADKGRMQNALSKSGKKITRVAKISMFEDQVVMAWRSVMDEVYRDSDNVWHEKQVVEITLENDKKVQLDYLDFQRLLKKVPCEIVGKPIQTNEDSEYDPATGATTKKFNYKLKIIETGREIVMDGLFVN